MLGLGGIALPGEPLPELLPEEPPVVLLAEEPAVPLPVVSVGGVVLLMPLPVPLPVPVPLVLPVALPEVLPAVPLPELPGVPGLVLLGGEAVVPPVALLVEEPLLSEFALPDGPLLQAARPKTSAAATAALIMWWRFNMWWLLFRNLRALGPVDRHFQMPIRVAVLACKRCTKVFGPAARR